MTSSSTSQAAEIAARTLMSLEELAQLSSSDVGVTRVAYSAEDMQAKEWFRSRCEAGGLDFEMDEIGNCFAWTPHARGRRPVMMGSHLDSVIAGGKFDGTLGVALALELASHAAAAKSAVPMCVVNFACEESTRFGFGPVGSRALFGRLPRDAFPNLVDRNGETLEEVLQRAGLLTLRPLRELEAAVRRSCCYVEVHIDQGTMLDSADLPLGIVTTIAGIGRTSLRWSGEAAHSGARYHRDRRDALLAAAMFVTAADEIWTKLEGPVHTLAITIGQFTVHPNSPNTVSGRVELILDVRSDRTSVIDEATTALCDEAQAIGARRRVDVSAETIGIGAPASMDDRLVGLLEERARRASLTASRVVSLSGHDAMVLTDFMPTGMILLRNPSGISHSPSESVDEESIVMCSELLLDALPRIWEACHASRWLKSRGLPRPSATSNRGENER